jgi:surface antigen
MKINYQLWSQVVLSTLIIAGCSTQTPEDQVLSQADQNRYLGGVLASGSGVLIPGDDVKSHDASGTLVGAFVVQSIDLKMSEANRLKMANMLEYQTSNQWERWNDNANHTMYSLKTGTPAFGDDEVCRHYDLVAKSSENYSQASGIACRQSNGNWLLNV